MTKKELRIKYKALRNDLAENAIEEMSLAIANRSLALPIWDKNYFHIFLPITGHKEINTEYILHVLSGKDKNIIVPKSDFDSREMTHFLLTDNTRLAVNMYGIPEPVEGIEILANKIEVVFIPLLAYDKIGHRVGYGKGFYDRFLSGCSAETIKIGLSLFEAEEIISDVLESDVRLNYCVTPNEIHSF